MSSIDLLKSLLRSSALTAASGLRNLPGTAALERLVADAQLGRTRIADAKLTAAVGRLSGVRQATLSSAAGRIDADVTFDDDSRLVLALVPAGVQFAPGGAKEVAFQIEPPEHASGRALELVAAIATEVARTLWSPVLSRAPRSRTHAYASRDGARVVVDLRNVPEVRWALSHRWGRAAIELLRLKRLVVEEGKLTLGISLEGLR